jgi:hypothetical protein
MQAPRGFHDLQDWLYVIIVGALALYLVIGILAWTWMILAGISAPDAFTTTIAAVVGALAGMVTPLQRPGERKRPDAEGGPPVVRSG